MQVPSCIEQALEAALGEAPPPETPPGLHAAMRHAVFPGGARLRPGLCVAIASACMESETSELRSSVPLAAVAAVSAAVELLHCASLVHDDLPCFDDAALRRGRRSVHVAFGEEIAVLVGDALIVLAFETLASAELPPSLVAPLVRCLARGVGPRGGLVAGQAWESEAHVGLSAYHKAKTGALFEAGARAGALLAHSGPQAIEAWALFGGKIGEAYQVADDLRDALADEATLGKPVGQDMAHDRPNACVTLGIDGALESLRGLLDQALHATPACPRPDKVKRWVEAFGARLYPQAVGVHLPSANDTQATDLRA